MKGLRCDWDIPLHTAAGNLVVFGAELGPTWPPGFDPMRRREFIAWLGGAAAVWPLAGHAQQPNRVRRVGWLSADVEDLRGHELVAAFRKRLAELGWIEGQNLLLDYRWASSSAERLRTYAQELVALKSDAIVASSPAVAALQQATRTIPIVFVGGADPVAEGYVESLARPGGNVTGFSNNAPSIATKRLQL